MKLGISGQALGRTKSLDEILQVLARHQVHYIELWPDNIPLKEGADNPYQNHRYEGRDVEWAARQLASFGIEVACVTMPGAFSKEFAADPDAYTQSLIHCLEIAASFGTAVVNHYCAEFAQGHDADILRFLGVLEPAVQRAEELGVTMVLEPEAHDASGTPQGMRKIVDTVGSDRFLVNFDPCNFYHAGQEAFPWGYTVLRDCIGYVHLKNGCLYDPSQGHMAEAKGAPFGGHLAPNRIYYPVLPQGAVNIDGLCLSLIDDNYSGVCTLEPHVKPQYVETYYEQEISYLRQRGYVE